MEQIKVMIVDDHQIFIDGIKALLSNEENILIVAHANNGRDAIKIIENTPVDIILMDIEMPILNGYDTTAIVTTRFPHIKVISLTTHDEKSIVNKMLNAGASGYVLKNIDKEILLVAIHTVFKGQMYFSSEIPVALATNSSEEVSQIQNKNTDVASLSDREIEIVRHIANGLSNNEVAKKLFISPKTVDTHRSNIMQKLDIHNVVGLVKYAIKSGIIS